MQLKTLAAAITSRQIIGTLDRAVEGIAYDSRRVQRNFLFVALGGERNDGHQFLLTTNTLSTETVFAFNLGLGTDFRIPLKSGGVALRLEVADHIAGSPLAFRVEELSSFGTVPIDTGSRYRLVHHLSATAGVVVQIGR